MEDVNYSDPFICKKIILMVYFATVSMHGWKINTRATYAGGWCSNPGLAKSYTALQTALQRFNIYTSVAVLFGAMLCRWAVLTLWCLDVAF